MYLHNKLCTFGTVDCRSHIASTVQMKLVFVYACVYGSVLLWALLSWGLIMLSAWMVHRFMEGLFECFLLYCPYNNIRNIPLQEIITCRFPNPPGSNRCWMNATLQMLLGMEPFMEELECFCLRRDQNNRCEVLQSFFEVMKYRRWRRRLSLRFALRWVLSQSLGTNIGSLIYTGETCTSNPTDFCMTVKEWAINEYVLCIKAGLWIGVLFRDSHFTS